MKKLVRLFFFVLASSMLMISQLNAQTVLCVDRDWAGDTSSTYTDTWPMIKRALDAAGYTYEHWDVTDANPDSPDAAYMGDFDVVIWLTGEAWTGHETMGEGDEFELTLYMTLGGGKLFMNAQDWLYDVYPNAGTFTEGEFPYDMLGIVNVEQDVYHIEPGDPQSIADSATFLGAPGSLAEGLAFPTRDIFTTDSDDGLYGDSIAEHLGQSLMTVQYPYISPGPPAIQFETSYFRSVFTTIDVAAITDTIARNILVHRIIDWLEFGPTGVRDLKANDAELLIRPNPVSSLVDIGMIYPMEEVSVYSNQGQLVRHETTDRTSIKMDLSDLAPGMYVLKVKTLKGIVTSKLIKK
jgi:hypothetical protein